MMGTWSSVIATNPDGPEAPVRATPLADHFRRAVTAFHAFRMISSCRRPKPSPMPRICSIGAWRSTPTRCSRPRGRTAQTTNVKGAITVLRRASAGLAQNDRPAPYAIDVAGLVDYADVLIDDLAANAGIIPERLRPHLVVVPPQ